jgi:hypothetical protein
MFKKQLEGNFWKSFELWSTRQKEYLKTYKNMDFLK